MRSLLFVMAMMGAAAGCQTQFVGDAHIDPGTCQAKCTASGLTMAGMVYLGEYSSACLCEVPAQAVPNGPPPGPPPPPPPGMPPGPPGAPVAPGATAPHRLAMAAGAMGATAGVIMQMRRAEQNNNNPGFLPGTPPNIRPAGPRM